MRYTIWRFVPLLMVVMLTMSGCGATKKQSSSESRSELSQNHESRVDHREASSDQLFNILNAATQQSRKSLLLQEEIPAAKAVVTIPLNNLINLPPGAGYTARSENGRASLELTRDGDHIVATSRCDSIARRCLYMECEVFRQRTQIDSLTKTLSGQTVAIHRADSLLASHATSETSLIEKPPIFRWFNWFSIGVLTGVMATTLLLKTDILKRVAAAIKRLLS